MAQQNTGALAELQCINYIFQKNSLQVAVLNGLTEEHFTTYKEHFKYVVDFYNKYNQLPSREAFQVEFQDKFDWLNVTDPEKFIVDKLKETKLYRDLIVDYNKLAELLRAEKSDIAVEKMGEIAQKYLKEKSTPVVDLISDASIRYDNYLEKATNPQRAFITTGIKELDDILGGWDMENESAVVAARTGFGKSWWLIYFAMQAAKQGLRVGFYSGEMETDLVGYRMDTFLGGIANGSMTHGNINIKDQYKDYIEDLNKIIPGHIYCVTPDMLGGNATVSKLRAFIEKYDIEMLCVDQFSLLEDERRAKNPIDQMSNISKDLRTLQRLKKIPFIMASQLNRNEQEDGPSTRNISQSDRVGQDATTILFIERKQGDQVIFTVGKARNAKTGDKLTYIWNINLGTLNYVPTENDAKGGEDSKKLEESYNDSSRSSNVF